MTTLTGIAANKALVARFFEAFSASRFDLALDLMAEGGTWWVAGTTEISGTYTKEEFRELATGVTGGTRNGVQLTATGMTAEGNRVAVEAVSDGETLGGKRYQNRYHFLFEFDNGQITAVREYMDPMHVREVFGV
jgi:ketosteroid isomerase-like protein